MRILKILLISALSTALCSCEFFDKDNTPPPSPLVSIKPEIRIHTLWAKNTGSASTMTEYLKFPPAITDTAVYSATKDGTIIATNKRTGKTFWTMNVSNVLTRDATISSGPDANGGVVIMGSSDGDVIALDQVTGRLRWKTKVSSEILAPPASAEGVALVKSIDGKLSALSTEDGHNLWSYQQTEPTLIMRGSSAPQIHNGSIIVGFANGNLAKLTLREGSLHWLQTVAIPQGSFSIQRMIDIDANPIVINDHIYAATYQGRVASLDYASGKILWSYDLSSYSGIAADHERVYVSDAKSHIWAFDAESGVVDWNQGDLAARNITGPAIIGNYIVVGDEEGYLHWMSKQDGHFVGRTHVDNAGILATPIVDNNVIYVVSRDGRLSAYTLE